MPTAIKTPTLLQRNRWRITGQVQGVGMRPFVYRVATQCGLTGFVLNDADGVTIEVQGNAGQLQQFDTLLHRQRPLLATYDTMTCQPAQVMDDDHAFVIAHSLHGDAPTTTAVTVDTAVCDDCLAELFDVADQRYRYGLINCTNCGPRFSIIQAIPYDRPNTTMASFTLCPTCAAQYDKPTDRRFHAQPIACDACGPRVTLRDTQGADIAGDPYVNAARLLENGHILAIKGLGGFHLACRADDASAIQLLRDRKHRDDKPLALMARDLDTAKRLVHLTEQAVATLTSPRRPIVLAPARDAAAAVAPGNHRLGIMLPYTPMQHLLFAELNANIDALVMTSGNLTDEPIAIDNDEAHRRLQNLCDGFLQHDRPIERCVDDSVMLSMADGAVVPLRRARGFAPATLRLPIPADAPGLCVGGELKNTVAVVRGRDVILSQHIGDLTDALALEHFRKAIVDLCNLFEITPQWIAHDLHPMYLSTAHARRLAAQWNVPLYPVQHHHAHAASLLAEHQLVAPALAIVCDGVGYGDDGTSWGGELLLADLTGYQRLAHLRPLRLPGGDAAARDTRRCAMALLYQALGDDFAAEDDVMATMIRRNVHCAESSAAGRLFDAAASLLGICERNRFEAQAPMRLESLAAGQPAYAGKPLFTIADGLIDMSPMVSLLQSNLPLAQRAAAFHDQLAAAFAQATLDAARLRDLHEVVLTGGVMCNERFTAALTQQLRQGGLTVLHHSQVPPGDGGLALGQAAVASARRKEGA